MQLQPRACCLPFEPCQQLLRHGVLNGHTCGARLRKQGSHPVGVAAAPVRLEQLVEAWNT
eukprot:357516-Chlamydomonas_euryale.AAC.5